MNDFAPILFFVYNRPEHTKRTIESLQKTLGACESELLIYSDGAKLDADKEKVSTVRDYLNTIDGFKSIIIIKREHNFGLANSVISGVGEVLKIHNSVIVLEDDLNFSKNFLLFMNTALKEFQNVENVFSISGYNFPIDIPKDYKENIYLSPRASSWGWATWKDRWEKADWSVSDFKSFINNKSKTEEFNKGGNDLTRMLKNQVEGKIDSWAIRWSYAHYKNKAYCVYPVKSKVQNIGTDSSGLHSITTNKFFVDLDLSNDVKKINTRLTTNEIILSRFRKFFKFTLWERIYWKVKRNFKIINQLRNKLMKLFAQIFINGFYNFLTDKFYRQFMKLVFLYGGRPRYELRSIKFLNFKMIVPDCRSFIWQFKEIFVDKNYLFKAENDSPVIYDCGSNIGTKAFIF